jgi:hypothetical protein
MHYNQKAPNSFSSNMGYHTGVLYLHLYLHLTSYKPANHRDGEKEQMAINMLMTAVKPVSV